MQETSGSSATPATVPPPGASFSFTSEELAQLLGTIVSKLQRAPTAEAVAGTSPVVPSQVTAESFPAFSMASGSQPTPGMSLLDQFPSVKAGVLLDIARHDFEPSDLYKLDSKYRDKAERSVLDLSVYFRILTAFASSSGNPLFSCHVATSTMEYLCQLQKFHEEYQWSAVLSYHMEFHHRRLREMTRGDYSKWGMIDASLQVQHLFGRERVRTAGHSQAGVLKPAGPRDASGEVCQNFNRGKCDSPCRNRRAHKCSTCGGDHSAAACTSKASA
ncbi:hypothetical protein FOMPIDRAFT_1029190 [Fomitopsis schrenkii]|uniref:Uncharacterized protein n=1 Tax=Fomitopsis schrenkii TaxID=2126942 RepID=S8EHZ2_FOMSC|nr:hypothetical protein FOMPIDRAFT_1029190 [Fomitopsis schrenkii]